MGFREVVSLDAEVTIGLGGVNKKTGKKNPTSIEGYYLGSRSVEGKKGESKIHFFQTSKGNVGVWGKTDSNRKLGGVTPGTMTRISFDKMQDTPNGEMYKYKVEVDGENTIEVGGLSAAALDSDSTINDAGDGFSSDEDTSDDSESLPYGAGQLNDRAARVQALLGKKKA